MTYIDEMIKERCPNGVKWKELGRSLTTNSQQSIS